VIAAKMNRIVAIVNSRALIVIYHILFPILWLMDTAIAYLLRKLKAEGRDYLSKHMSVLSEEDFMLLMEEGHREGTVDPAERKLIKNVLEFDDSTVNEVLTPMAQAFSVPVGASVAEILPEIRSQKYSRIPVYQKTKRNIVGVLYVKDL
jgi:putative hemolysin